MSDVVIRTAGVADSEIHDGGRDFEFPKDAAGALPYQRIPVPPKGRELVAGTLSDYSTDIWVSETFVRIPFPSAAANVEPGDFFLSERDSEREAFLARMRDDLAELHESVRFSAGGKLCHRFIETAGLALAQLPAVRAAIFGDEEDGVEFVAHSGASKRQVSFEFRLEAETITIVRIDENMQRFETQCRIEHVKTLAEAIGWLTPR